MQPFLRDEIRKQLAEEFVSLKMPGRISDKLLNVPEDIRLVDCHLAAIARNAIRYREQLDTGKEDGILPLDIMKMFLVIDVLIIAAFFKEAGLRGIPDSDLPLTLETITAYNELVEEGNHTLQ
jgi:hypothetical protein